ncbi:hypothetical protein [Microbulbifer sp. SSSA005]|uniref:hypothetical protein n=1 Tax=Microbulbifer sp. SSSA005 TaxID=3243378 RepID=UPI00403914FF
MIFGGMYIYTVFNLVVSAMSIFLTHKSMTFMDIQNFEFSSLPDDDSPSTALVLIMDSRITANWLTFFLSLFFLSACEGSYGDSVKNSVFYECRNQWKDFPSNGLQQAFRDFLHEYGDADAYILVRLGMADYGYFEGLFVAVKGDQAFVAKSKDDELIEKRFKVNADLESNFLKLKKGIIGESYTKSAKSGLHATCKFIDVKVDDVGLSFETTYNPAWMDDYMLKDLSVELSQFDEALHYFLNI